MNKLRHAADIVTHRWLRVPYPLHVSVGGAVKRPAGTVLLLHGIGNSKSAWRQVIAKLEPDYRVVSVDLLGFGQSPKPTWATYDASTQAKSVIATLLKVRRMTPLIVVGHSLGSLVAIELTRRYPALVKSLVLCSPPLYVSKPDRRLIPHAERTLQRIYEQVINRPEQFVRLSAFAMKYNLINPSYNVTSETIHSYVATLKAAIINQTAFDAATVIKKPIVIIRGRLDPLVILANLKRLKAANPSVVVTSVLAAHELNGLFVAKVVAAIRRQGRPRKV